MVNNDNITENKGWISEIVTAVITAFNKFISIFKNNGIIYSLVLMLIFILFHTLIVNPIRLDNLLEQRLQHQWEKEKKEEVEKKQENEDKRLKADELITPIMEELQAKYNLDRVILFEAHNNSTNIANLPFLFYSASYEVINIDDYDTDYISDSFQRQYTTNFLGNENFVMLQHKDYLYFNNLKNYKRNKSRLLVKMKRLSIDNVMLIPIHNKKQQPILLLVICNNNPINCDEVFDYLKPFLNQIMESLIVD